MDDRTKIAILNRDELIHEVVTLIERVICWDGTKEGKAANLAAIAQTRAHLKLAAEQLEAEAENEQ